MDAYPKPPRVARVAVLLELEDGSTLALYAQPDPANNDAAVTMGHAEREPLMDWGGHGAVRRPRRVDHHIHVDGLHEYRAAEAMPEMVRHLLDSIKAAVNL